MNQNEEILGLLRKGPITALDAAQHGCMRLAARVHELRNQGHQIFTEPSTQNGKSFAKYYLIKEAKDAAA